MGNEKQYKNILIIQKFKIKINKLIDKNKKQRIKKFNKKIYFKVKRYKIKNIFLIKQKDNK